MNPSSTLWAIMKIYGMNKTGSRRMLYCSIYSVYMLAQAVLCSVMKWDNLSFRYLALEDVACTVFSTAMIFEHTFKPDSIFRLMKVIDRPVYNRYNKIIGISENRESLTERENQSTANQIKQFTFFLAFFMLNVAVPSFLISWYRIISNSLVGGTELALADLMFPYEKWFPFEPDNLSMLCLVLTISDALYLTTVTYHMLLSLGSTIVSIRRIANDIKLLEESINEIDIVFKTFHGDDRTLHLKKYIRLVVKHHNIILRDVKGISVALSFSSLNMHSCAFLLSGLSMYWFIEGSSSVDRMRYVISVATVAAIVYVYSVNGQLIQSEGEDLRHVLYGYSWTDKPEWFKKSLLVILTQATKPLQIKPLGLYVLDFDSFTSMLNGAYAFTNILRTFKKRQHSM